MPESGVLPFDNCFPSLIEWHSPRPVSALPDPGLILRRLKITHPDADHLQDTLAPFVSAMENVRIVQSPTPGLTAEISTPFRRNLDRMTQRSHLRVATPSDAAALKIIMAPVIAGSTASFSSEERDVPAWADMVADRLARGRAFYVAEVEGEVVGYATYDQFRPGNNGYRFTMEHSVYLGDKAQGHGLGRILMLTIEEHAREAGRHSMIGVIDSANAASIAFHKALGYKEAGRVPQAGFKFERWLDVLFMQKFL